MDHLVKIAARLEPIVDGIRYLHNPPIACKPEIADGMKQFQGFFFIRHQQSPLLQQIKLLEQFYRLFVIFHDIIKTKSCRGTHLERRGRNCCCKSAIPYLQTFSNVFHIIHSEFYCFGVGKIGKSQFLHDFYLEHLFKILILPRD